MSHQPRHLSIPLTAPILLAVLLLPAMAAAQARSVLTGTVTAPDGTVIVDAAVTVASPALPGGPAATTTNGAVCRARPRRPSRAGSGGTVNLTLRSGGDRFTSEVDFTRTPRTWVSDNRGSLSPALRARFRPRDIRSEWEGGVV
jgi:hypothetical protein